MFVAAVLLAAATVFNDPFAPADRWGHEPYHDVGPLGVAVSPVDGHIYVADGRAALAEPGVIELDADLKPTGTRYTLPLVSGVAVAADGRIAAVSASGVVVLLKRTADGTLEELQTLGTPAWQPPAAGTPDPTPDTTPDLAADPGRFDRPCGAAFDAAGNLFVFDTFNGRVQVFGPDGRFRFAFGEYRWTRNYESEAQGKRIEEEVATRLYRPVRGAFLPDGRLIVADYDGPIIDPELNRRAGMFSVWEIDVAAATATFVRHAAQGDAYPDSKAGDVCVDAARGLIYYAEADFPLTDHANVRATVSVDDVPHLSNNFQAYLTLTHPRGLAVAANGEVLVAEADLGQVFPLPTKLMHNPPHKRDPLAWPKVLRVPVTERERVVVEYTTLVPVLSEAQYAPLPGDGWYQHREMVPVAGRQTITHAALNPAWEPLPEDQPGTNHRIEFTGLQPGTRYAWRFLVSPRGYPEPLWSETFIFATQPPEGETQYIDAEVTVLLFTNLVTPPRDANVTPEPADPGPMTDEEIAGVKYRMEMARRFYWINSRARFNLRYNFVIEPERYDPAPVHNYGYWPHDDHRKIDAVLAKHGVKHADTAGLFVIYGYRHWDAHQRQWVLSGSGGNTWGSCHNGSGVAVINAGGDTCWLFTHEYGHCIDINYGYSGHDFHFNHFHWNYLPTNYGSHYDGCAALMREFSDAGYWSLRYGRLVRTADVDGDGLPDLDPRAPLDEKRFGSDARLVDTDGDGLADLEELMATQGVANYAEAFGRRQIEPVFEPDPQNPDTDGDGIPDGADRYPLYPWSTEVHMADVTVDGVIGAAEWPQQGFVRTMRDRQINGDVRLAWNRRHLLLGMKQKVVAGEETPARLYIEFDFNNDGMTVGSDNVEMELTPQPDGTVRVRTKHNDTVIRIEPFWRDNILPNPRDMQARWTKQGDEYHLEVAIPQTKDAGLDLDRFEQLSFMIELSSSAWPQGLRLFEPQSHFEVTLR
jgi:hypothetical protein